MSNQSSVEWLFHEFISCSLKVSDIFKLLEQAKAMHKEESVDFALYAMMAESFNDLPEATKKQIREAIEVKYKEHYKL